MDKQFYRLCLDDYSAVSFCSFGKYYYGTVEMISEFIAALKNDTKTAEAFADLIAAHEAYINGNKNVTHNTAYQEVPYLVPVKFLGEAVSCETNLAWEHRNTYDWIYDMHCKKAESQHIWFSCRGEYTRCIQTKFTDLQYKNTIGTYRPLSTAAFWGHPHILITTPPYLQNRLFVIEKVFSDRAEALADMTGFSESKDIGYAAVLDDVFGDG